MLHAVFFFLLIRQPPRSPRFPYTTLFRSVIHETALGHRLLSGHGRRLAHPAVAAALAGARPLLRWLVDRPARSEEHTSELQSRQYLVCRLLLEKKNDYQTTIRPHVMIRHN